MADEPLTPSRKLSFRDVLVFLLVGCLCFPILLLLLPNLEQGRREARLSHTFYEVIRLRELQTENHDDKILPAELDPWGNPYHMETMHDGHVRVISSGPNGSSPDAGLDDDDIHSDLTVSPAKPIQAKKRQQGRNAFAVTLLVWIAGCVVYWKLRPAGSTVNS